MSRFFIFFSLGTGVTITIRWFHWLDIHQQKDNEMDKLTCRNWSPLSLFFRNIHHWSSTLSVTYDLCLNTWVINSPSKLSETFKYLIFSFFVFLPFPSFIFTPCKNVTQLKYLLYSVSRVTLSLVKRKVKVIS